MELFVPDISSYGGTNSGLHNIFIFPCEHYHMEVNPKQEIQAETKIGDIKMNSGFMFAYDFFVCNGLSYNNADSVRDEIFSCLL